MKTNHKLLFIIWFVSLTLIVVNQSWGQDAPFENEESSPSTLFSESSDTGIRTTVVEDELNQLEETLTEPAVGSIDSLLDAEESGAIDIQIRQGRFVELIDVKNIDIREVLEFISLKSGVSFAIDPNVSGTITAYVKNLELEVALRVILDTNDLAYRLKDGEFRIMSAGVYRAEFGTAFDERLKTAKVTLLYADSQKVLGILEQMKSYDGEIIFDARTSMITLLDKPEQVKSMVALIEDLDVPIETEIFELKFAKASTIVPRIREILTDSLGRVQFDERSNTIVVTDKIDKINEISKLVEKYDEEPKAIEFETKVIQVTLNEEHIMGIDWEAIVSNFQSIKFPGFSGNQLGSDGDQLSIGTVSDEDYKILLEALDTVGLIDTISKSELSSVVTKATQLKINSQDLDGLLQTAQSSRIPIREEVIFDITPDSFQEDVFSISLKPEISRSGNVRTSEPTTIDIENGATIVIGSLFKDKLVDQTRKIPLLGDLPFLGFAFSFERQRLQKTEVIVFIVPKFNKQEESQ